VPRQGGECRFGVVRAQVRRNGAPGQSDAVAPADADGWFSASLSVGFAGTDSLSGLDSCSAAQSYSGPDTVSAVVSGTCLDKAGNGGLASYGFKYDATAPVATATLDPQPNTAGWNNAKVTVTFAGSDVTAGIESCDAAKSYSGPDTQSTTLSGTCKDKAGNADTASRTLKYEATAPTSGPDGEDVPISGQCIDAAGNVGSKWFSIDYDDTGPQAAATPSRGPDVNGWYNQALTVSFTGSDPV
jgi:hypothetical protein